MSQGTLHCAQATIVRERRHHFVDEVHRCIFEAAGWIAARIANNKATRGVGRFPGNTRQFQSNRVGQRHVAVIPAH